MPLTPFMKTVTLTTANTNYNLLTLMQGLDPGQNGRYSQITIQNDIGNGAAKVFVGNDDLSGSNYGSVLVAGVALPLGPTPQNLLNAANIQLRTDTNSTKVNITAVQQ